LTDSSNNLDAGLIVLNEEFLRTVSPVVYTFEIGKVQLVTSCVFVSASEGLATLNTLSGAVEVRGEKGVEVYTGNIDGVPTLQVNILGQGKEECEDGSTPVSCIQFIQEAGAPLSADSSYQGAVVLNGTDTFTGEALCESSSDKASRTLTAEQIIAQSDIGQIYSPENWQHSAAIRQEMRDAGWFWAIADGSFNLFDGVQQNQLGLVIFWTSGSPYIGNASLNNDINRSNVVFFRGDYEEYGYKGTDHSAKSIYTRNYTLYSRGQYIQPIHYIPAYNRIMNTMHNIQRYNARTLTSDDDKFFVEVSVTNFEVDTGTVFTVDKSDLTEYLFAALVPTKVEPFTPPTEEVITLVCARKGNIDIYAPHHEASSNPIKSDRLDGSIKLRTGV